MASAAVISERSIVLSGDSIPAACDKRKTQTRRIIKLTRGFEPGTLELDGDGNPVAIWKKSGCLASVPCPYGKAGDLLYVKETWHADKTGPGADFVRYKARGDALHALKRWKSPRFMPKRHARIWLRVVSVRAELLQEISFDDCRAEGVESDAYLAKEEWEASVAPPGSIRSTVKTEFRVLWDSINGRRDGCAWIDNPFVWVISFERTSR